MNLLNFDISLKFPGKAYKRFLKKLETFIRFSATIGIHKAQGQQKVLHRYAGTTRNKDGKPIMHTSGRGYAMTISKLAYQNEFGATILIKPRYRYASKTTTKTDMVYHRFKRGSLMPKYKQQTKTRVRSSVLRKANEQGYLLTDKNGKFVNYFRPNSIITIPRRSFISKVVNEPNARLEFLIHNVLRRTFTSGGFRARAGFVKLAQIVERQMKQNVRHQDRQNHPFTVKAKGSNTPLRDNKDRLYKAIKYKIYKDVDVKGSAGYYAFTKQQTNILQTLIKKVDQYEILPTLVDRTISRKRL